MGGILLILIIFGFFNASYINQKHQTVSVVVITSEEFDSSLPFVEQAKYLTIEQMPKTDFKDLMESVLTSFVEIKGKKLKENVDFELNEPILLREVETISNVKK